MALSQAMAMNRNFDKALSEAERAADLEHNSVVANGMLGIVLFWIGQYDQSIPVLKKAARLSPVPHPPILTTMGSCYRNLGRYQDSIDVLKELMRREPDSLTAHLSLTATYVLAGNDSEARAEAAEVLRINPHFSLEQFANAYPGKNRKDLMDFWVEPMRKAGLK
jgi:tetratricopeptide (TPR) repeat protein